MPTSIIPTTTFPSTPGGKSKTTFDVELDTCSLCHNPNGDIYFRGLIITGKCFIFIMVSLVISWIITKFTLAWIIFINVYIFVDLPPCGITHLGLYFVVTEKQTILFYKYNMLKQYNIIWTWMTIHNIISYIMCEFYGYYI